MPWKLNPMTIQPTTRNHSCAIIESHARLSENGSQEIPDYTSNSVRCENLQKKGIRIPLSELNLHSIFSKKIKMIIIQNHHWQLTSKESSYPAKNLSCVAKLHRVPAITPNTSAAAVKSGERREIGEVSPCNRLGKRISPTRTNKTRSRSNSHKTSDSARAKSDCRPLSLDAIVLIYL